MLDNKEYVDAFKNNPSGRKVIEELVSIFYNVPTYNANSTHDTAYNEGKRAVVGMILNKIRHNPGE